MVRLAIITLVSLATSIANADDVVEIPLEEIWALNMPGTKDVREIARVDTDREPARPSNLDLVIRSLVVTPTRTMPTLMAPGNPTRAVASAATALRKRDPLFGDRGPISGSDDWNIVFYKFVSAYDVEIVSVERKAFHFNISYRFVPKYQPQATVGFAVIPCGKITAGNYHINIEKLPMEQRYLDAGFKPADDKFAQRLVSGDFVFDVIEEQRMETPDDAIVIPREDIWYSGRPNSAGFKVLADLEPECFIMRDTPESIAKYANYTAEEMQDLSDKLRMKSLSIPLERAVANMQTPTRSGFAISGTPKEALRQVHSVVVEGEEPRRKFTSDQDINLFFFSVPRQSGINIEEVVRNGQQIIVRYRISPSQLTSMKSTLAIIPLGRLPIDDYSVEYVLDEGSSPDLAPNLSDAICKPFNFLVIK